MVSKETQLSMLPSSVVPDIKEELERIKEEKGKEEFGYEDLEEEDET